MNILAHAPASTLYMAENTDITRWSSACGGSAAAEGFLLSNLRMIGEPTHLYAWGKRPRSIARRRSLARGRHACNGRAFSSYGHQESSPGEDFSPALLACLWSCSGDGVS